ncbi:unnamed protein product [Amoebophrya sp. A25]|nr:unnamed protein product [Amoebophrya sp. A25]|eukprot:GSA25T00009686001.1
MSIEDPQVDSDASSDGAPDLENVKDGADMKQNRAEKKCRKAVQKLGLKAVPGIIRVTVKKHKNILFVISKPEVLKAGNSETYVIFGEAKIEDVAASAQRQQMMMQAAKKQQEAAAAKASEAAPAKIEEVAEEAAPADKGNVEEKDIELVIQQVNCSRAKAIEALKKNNNDIVEAIMSLS